MLRTKFARTFPRSSVKLFPKRTARAFQRSNVAMFQARPVGTPPERSQDKNARIFLLCSAMLKQTSSATIFPSSSATWSIRRAVKMFPRSSAPPCPSNSARKFLDRFAKLLYQLMEKNSNLVPAA